MDCKYCAGAGSAYYIGIIIACPRCRGTGKEANHG